MITDKLTTFCNGVSVAGAAGTALIGDVIDLQNLRDLGPGTPVYLVMSCETSIITGGAAGTITFKLASDSTAAIATDGSATEHFVTGAFVTDDAALNDLDAGSKIVAVQLPHEFADTYERYLGILAVVGTTTVTAGAIDAFLTRDVSAWKAYADAVN